MAQVMQRGGCADNLLRALGVKWTLAPQLFAYSCLDHESIARNSHAPADALLIKNVLPGISIKPIVQCLKVSSPPPPPPPSSPLGPSAGAWQPTIPSTSFQNTALAEMTLSKLLLIFIGHRHANEITPCHSVKSLAS